MTWRRRDWGNSGVQGDGVSFLPYLLHQAGKLWCGHKMRELEIDDNIRSTHLHGLLQFQLPSFASLSAHVRNLHNPPSDGIHLLFRMGGKLSLPFLFTSRRFFLFLSLLGSSSRLFPVWKPTSLELLLLLLPLLHSCCCFSSWEKTPEPQRKKPILPIPTHSKTSSSSSSAQSACAFVLESVVVHNLETSKLRRQRQRRCHVDEMKTDENTITHRDYCSLVCWGYATLHFGEADGERKEEYDGVQWSFASGVCRLGTGILSGAGLQPWSSGKIRGVGHALLCTSSSSSKSFQAAVFCFQSQASSSSSSSSSSQWLN